MSSFVVIRGGRSPSAHQPYETIYQERGGGWESQALPLYGVPELFWLPLLLRLMTKTICHQSIGNLFFLHSLSCLNAGAPSPQIDVRHLLNGPGSIMFPPQVQLTL